MSRHEEKRILILHPWIVEQRGGERSFYEMARAFPAADLGLLFNRSASLPPDISSRLRVTSFLNRDVFRSVPYRALAPLLPLAAERLDTTGYDLILSSSSGWSHGVLPEAGARHFCYMHTPPRYLWSEDPPIRSRPARILLRPLVRLLRRWDRAAARRVDAFAANSSFVRSRIEKTYGRSAVVINPPVDLARRRLNLGPRRDFALTVAELVPYKRVDLAIGACRAVGLPLVVVGDGPERARLQKLAAGASVTFAGRVTEAALSDLMAEATVFLYPALEDFGLVTVEALASGTPVVGLRRGGTGEIVSEDSGELVDEQATEPFAEALSRSGRRCYDRPALRRRAELFGTERFRDELRAWLTPAARPDETEGRPVRGGMVARGAEAGGRAAAALLPSAITRSELRERIVVCGS